MSHVFHRELNHPYPKAEWAAGLYVEDEGGDRYLDMCGGAAVSCLGHGHPEVLDAIHAQLDRMAYTHTSFFTNEPAEQLAALLTRRFDDADARIYFTSGGSEANETALKVAWQYWQARGQPTRKIIISREHSYHGNTLGGLSVSGNPARRAASAAPLHNWPRISPCYYYRCRVARESKEQYALRTANELAVAIETAGPENVAAFICEPVVGASLGVVAAETGYLQRVREICDKYEVLWIADEIMCGNGRTGTYFAHEFDGAKPDMVTLAKGIGGGYQPLAATIVSGRIMECLAERGFVHGHTYVGHSTACAAGLAVQQALDRDGLLARTRSMGQLFLNWLNCEFADHPHVGDIRGRGLFIGIELVADRVSRRGFKNRPDLAGALRSAAMREGLMCYPGSIFYDGSTVPHVLLAPPMVLEEKHIQECISKLRVAIERTMDG